MKYKVYLHLLYEYDVLHCDSGGEFEDFEAAKEYAIKSLESMIENLTTLTEDIKASGSFEDIEDQPWGALFFCVTKTRRP